MNDVMILVVEDDPSIQRLIAVALETQNYRYQMVSTGKMAVQDVLSHRPDLIILDLGLPDMEGVAIIESVRGWSSVPIIVVSARSDDKDKIRALDAGADDYLTKPFSVDELLARIRVGLRRVKSGLNPQEDPVYVNGRLKIDYAANLVYVADKKIHLTPIEYKLLCLLAKHTGKVLTYHFILKEVWGIYDNDSSALRVFMTTLRKKIEADPANPTVLQTHVGVGYRMVNVHEEK
ncbi:response regulator [Enterococcus sp. DIV0876]|uniref:response regulator n=1 Tax=Enterococcus sp. DIV0876 TaxID=2774633 RepID=UPI003D2FDF43